MSLISNRSKGQLAILGNFIISVFLVGVVGLFAFEVTRYFLAHDQLKTNVEVAALSCQTALASSGDPTSAANQQAAQAAGLQLFKQNYILGQPMSGATTVTNPGSLEPAPNNAQICFQFLDPITRQTINASGAGVSSGVTSSSTAGTLIQAIGAYCYSPAFGNFIGLGTAQFTFQVSSLSGVPKIDLIVLLDISGGMDDDTSVSFYQRYEGPSGTNWMILPNPVGGGSANGQLWSVWCPTSPGNPPVGANALPPCEYERINNSTCFTVHYSEGALGGSSKLLAGAGMGTPPGNACLGSPITILPNHNNFVVKKSKRFLHAYKTKIAQGRRTQFDSLKAHKKSKPYSEPLSDPGLLEICQKISGKKFNRSLIKKLVASQLDDKFSRICFNPTIINLGDTSSTTSTTSTTTSSTTSGSSSTGSGSGVTVTYTSTNPNVTPAPPAVYLGSDGMAYVPLSRVPGGGANSGPAVQPTIAGIGCLGGTSTITVGAPAQSVFTGLFVNGVIGAVNSSIPGMTIGNAATAIEASLGDLESTTNAQQAGVDTGALGVTPQAGWYAFYYQAARAFLQPLMSNINALTAFLNEMALISDIHYGFIAFNDNIGTSATSISAPVNNLSSAYNYLTPNPSFSSSINSTYPLPLIPLSSTDSKQAAIINILPTLSVWGGRNVTQALQAAAAQLQTNGRQGANQAILLVTDGAPNNGDTPAAAITQATTIGQSGIPVFVICTSVSSSYDSTVDDTYTDTGGAAGGVAAVSGHGAKYYRVDYVDPTTTQNKLTSIFANIARRLVSIIQSN